MEGALLGFVLLGGMGGIATVACLIHKCRAIAEERDTLALALRQRVNDEPIANFFEPILYDGPSESQRTGRRAAKSYSERITRDNLVPGKSDEETA